MRASEGGQAGSCSSLVLSFFFCCVPHLLCSRCFGPRCFIDHGEGAEGLLGALCRCRELQDGAEKVDVLLNAESPQPPLQKTYVAGEVAEGEAVVVSGKAFQLEGSCSALINWLRLRTVTVKRSGSSASGLVTRNSRVGSGVKCQCTCCCGIVEFII